MLVAKQAWFDNTNEVLSQASTAGKISVGKEKRKNEERGNRDKRGQKRETARLVMTYSADFEELSFEVRDGTGCPALLDSH